MTLSKAMKDYLRYHTSHKGGSQGSVDQYDRTYQLFLTYVRREGRSDEPAAFTADMVHAWALSEAERGVGPRTIATRLHQLGSLATYMLRLKDGRGRPLLVEDPTKAFGKPKFKKPETNLHPGELQKFRACAATRALGEGVACELLLDTMLRISEVINADVSDLAGPDGAGRYTLSVQLKGGARKAIPVSPEVCGSIREYLASRGGDLAAAAPLLANRDGQRWKRTAITQVVGRIAKQAGVTRFSVSAHKLRHTSATVALAAGVNPLAISKLLNHSSTRTTEQYLHLIPTALAEARDLARARARQPTLLERERRRHDASM